MGRSDSSSLSRSPDAAISFAGGVAGSGGGGQLDPDRRPGPPTPSLWPIAWGMDGRAAAGGPRRTFLSFSPEREPPGRGCCAAAASAAAALGRTAAAAGRRLSPPPPNPPMGGTLRVGWVQALAERLRPAPGPRVRHGPVLVALSTAPQLSRRRCLYPSLCPMLHQSRSFRD